MSIFIFGATDLTLKVVSYLYENKYDIGGIITMPKTFEISYTATFKNSRFVDLSVWAKERSLPCFIYEDVKKLKEQIMKLEGEKTFALVAGWYHMIPKSLRSLFTLGCGGFHASILPQLRGGAPLNWAILSKMDKTGVSFFQLADGVDDGFLYAQEIFKISEDDYISDLVLNSHQSVLSILEKNLDGILSRTLKPYKQTGVATYCGQRRQEDSFVDWSKMTADEVLRLIRASSHPYDGAYTYLDGEKVIIWKAQMSDINVIGVPGQIFFIENNIYICCKKDAIKIEDWTLKNRTKHNQKRLNSKQY